MIIIIVNITLGFCIPPFPGPIIHVHRRPDACHDNTLKMSQLHAILVLSPIGWLGDKSHNGPAVLPGSTIQTDRVSVVVDIMARPLSSETKPSESSCFTPIIIIIHDTGWQLLFIAWAKWSVDLYINYHQFLLLCSPALQVMAATYQKNYRWTSSLQREQSLYYNGTSLSPHITCWRSSLWYQIWEAKEDHSSL